MDWLDQTEWAVISRALPWVPAFAGMTETGGSRKEGWMMKEGGDDYGSLGTSTPLTTWITPLTCATSAAST